MNIFSKVWIYFFIIIFSGNAIAQKYICYKKDGKYGIKNKITGKIIIEPKYSGVVSIGDSTFAVQAWGNEYAIIDLTDKIVVPFSKDYTYFNMQDSDYLNQYMEFSSKKYYYNYYIYTSRKCITRDYFPCPYWKEMNEDSIQTYQKHLNLSFYYYEIGQFDSAIYFREKALTESSENPSVYYLCALGALNLKNGWIIANKKSFNQLEKYKIDYYLQIAAKLENRKVHLLQIYNLQWPFYKYIQKDRAMRKQVDLEADKIITYYNTSGSFLICGLSYYNEKEFELGYAFGSFNIYRQNGFPKHFFDSFLIGISYLRNYNDITDGYKIYLISFVKPLNVGLYPILYTDYDKSSFALRPELGFGSWHWSFSVGYNLFIGKNYWNYLNKLSFNLRYYLPMKISKTYY